MTKTIALLAALALCACQSCHPVFGPFKPDPAPQPEPPSPWDGPTPDGEADAAPPPAPAPTGNSCAAACATLAELGCPEAKPTPRGASCTDVCQNTLGSPVSLQPDCVVRATDCKSAEACQAIPQ